MFYSKGCDNIRGEKKFLILYLFSGSQPEFYKMKRDRDVSVCPRKGALFCEMLGCGWGVCLCVLGHDDKCIFFFKQKVKIF